MRKGSHSVYDIQYHIVWVTKYRKKILEGDISRRLREIIRQTCEKNKITIIKRNIRKDHVHMLISCPPILAPAKILQYIRGRSSKMLQEEYPELRKQYWGQHMWAIGYYCGTVGTVTEETIRNYIENQDDETLDEVFKIES